jgi:MFS family permease
VLDRPIWLNAETFLFAAVQVSWIGFVSQAGRRPLGRRGGGGPRPGPISGTLGRVFFEVLGRVLGGRRRRPGAGRRRDDVLCVATAWLGARSSAAALSLVAVGFGLTGIGWNGVHHTLLAEIAGRDSAATAVGLCLAISSVGVIVGAPLFGLAADRLRVYDWGWYGLAAAMLAALALLAGVREPRRSPWT